MKKKLLFVSPHLIAGGVEKSLLSLLSALPKDRYEITLLLVKARGEFLPFIPDHIIVREIEMPAKVGEQLLMGTKAAALNNLKNWNFLVSFKILIDKILLKKPIPVLRMSFDDLSKEGNNYDVAVCYHMHVPFIVRYVAEKVISKQKMAWVHNDFKMSRYNPKHIKQYIDDYSHFFTVSSQLNDEFVTLFPKCEKKTSVFYNILSKKSIENFASGETSFSDNFTGTRILSIGRLDKQKGFDIAIKVCSMLVENGFNIRWYIMGEGQERIHLEKMISKKNLQKHMILLGALTNPYPYIRDTDIYVQPSRHEGYCIALAEARCFNRPIVTTDFVGALEQIKHNQTGLIVKCTEQQLYHGIKKVLSSKDMQYKFSRNLEREDPSTEDEVKKLIDLIGII